MNSEINTVLISCLLYLLGGGLSWLYHWHYRSVTFRFDLKANLEWAYKGMPNPVIVTRKVRILLTPEIEEKIKWRGFINLEQNGTRINLWGTIRGRDPDNPAVYIVDGRLKRGADRAYIYSLQKEDKCMVIDSECRRYAGYR